MGSLYDTIAGLCAQKGETVTQMCRACGVSQASLTDLKQGRKRALAAATLAKIAAHFSVTVDSLLADAPAPQGGVSAADAALLADELVGFYGEVKGDLTAADIDDVKRLMRLRAELNRSKKD